MKAKRRRPIPRYRLSDPETCVYDLDCRWVMRFLPRASIDLIFADPPFNWGVEYGMWDDEMPWDTYLDFTYEWLDACIPLLSPEGSLWINVPDDWVAEIVVYLKSENLVLLNWCIWHYRFGQCQDSNFIDSKTHVLYFVSNPSLRIWNPDEILEPSDRAERYNDPRTQNSKTPGLRVPHDVWYGKNWGRIQGNNRERRHGHPNQLPEKYLERVIRACSHSESIVLDPFLGSGTTCTVVRKVVSFARTVTSVWLAET